MNKPFANKVALVTGAASAMGLATGQAFAEAGAAVVLADFRKDPVNAEAQKLTAAGHKAIAFGCDVSDDAQVAAMVDWTVAQFGRLDAAFNNAGVMARIAPTADSTREEWDRVIGINLRGVWSCPLRASCASGSLFDSCVSFERFSLVGGSDGWFPDGDHGPVLLIPGHSDAKWIHWKRK